MNEHILSYIVKPDDKYVFLREILISHLQVSHSLLVKLKSQHKIKVNGRVTFTNYRLRPGDLVTIDIALEEVNDIEPRPLPLDIIYEDPDCMIINKPPGLAVHSVKGIREITLANAVTHYWVEYGKSILFRPINRLDKETSGLIMVGKSQYAHQAIFRQQKQGRVRRRYLAVVEGIVKEDSGCINLPIARLDPDDRRRTVDPSGKPALTYFTVMQRYEGLTLLSLTLGTGRTHQIRVHLSHWGHPICGDSLYGDPSLLINRQALHAGDLSFKQPRTQTALHFRAPLPPDMSELLERLEAARLDG